MAPRHKNHDRRTLLDTKLTELMLYAKALCPEAVVEASTIQYYVEVGYRTEEDTFFVGDQMAEVGADIIEETGVLVALAPFVVEAARQP